MGAAMAAGAGPWGAEPLAPTGPLLWAQQEGGTCGLLLGPNTLRKDVLGKGILHNWLLLAPTAPTPARGLPTVTPPSPSDPQP